MGTGLQQVQEDFRLLQLSGYLLVKTTTVNLLASLNSLPSHLKHVWQLYFTILALGRICLRAVFPLNLTGKSPWCLPLG